ncbi:hypothetical protein Ddye_008882 [Dipteronia dyeriana]|uniref:DDE Tnp4 domain-containing protein n=1 Tax=Dipteronia dyeriana TaxID=168575 RepID=A0AAD9XAB6_9ROSI|nr:hypothetical protein Ddye_008882 [Dipteronia dyeriana]
MDIDSDEEIEEQIVEQAIRDEIEFNEVVVNVVRATVYHYNNFLIKEPCKNSTRTGWMFMMEILNGNDRRCQEQFRMGKHVFVKLCDRLRSYGLTSTKEVRLEEAVGMFLMTLEHGVGNRIIQEQFQHSGETVSRQFGIVLEKMTILAFDELGHLQNLMKSSITFEDCIGVIDGTHVRVSLPVDEQIPYIGRKGFPTQNIMVVCGFDMLFTFVWLGWERFAHDTRISLEALRNTELKFPIPPDDKYYLVNAGYPNMKGYLAPYKGERYHLPVFRTSGQPIESRETFNYVHSSLRSVIERCFGVWKARWKILQHMPNYKFDKQVTIVTASMALHNFIRREAIADIEFESYKEDEDYVLEDEESYMNLTIDESEMGFVHDRMARELMIV